MILQRALGNLAYSHAFVIPRVHQRDNIRHVTYKICGEQLQGTNDP
jgi:hypothetical protein